MLLMGVVFFIFANTSLLYWISERMDQNRLTLFRLANLGTTLQDYLMDSQTNREMVRDHSISHELGNGLILVAKATGSDYWFLTPDNQPYFHTEHGIPIQEIDDQATALGARIEQGEPLESALRFMEPNHPYRLIRRLFTRAPELVFYIQDLVDDTGFLWGKVLIFSGQGMQAPFLITSGNGMFVIFLVSFLLATVVASLISRKISNPINRLIAVSQEVYNGNLQARVYMNNGQKPDLKDFSEKRSQADLKLLSACLNSLLDKRAYEEQARTDFLAGLSHDLRSPLTSVKGYFSALRDGIVSPEDMPEIMDILDYEINRMGDLIDSFFQIYSLSNPASLKKELFNIEEMIDYQIKLKQPLWQERGLNLSFQRKLDGQLVMGDPILYLRVVQNILGNAIAYTPTGGDILIRTSLDTRNPRAWVSVEDSGDGIPEADRPFIFDRYYRAGKKDGHSGSGLGLFVSRSIVQLHRQEILVDASETLGGAQFSFSIALPEDTETESSPQKTQKKDQEDNR